MAIYEHIHAVVAIREFVYFCFLYDKETAIQGQLIVCVKNPEIFSAYMLINKV